jgi:hypothetical protein
MLQSVGRYADGLGELFLDLDAQGRITGGEFHNATTNSAQVNIKRDSTGIEVDRTCPGVANLGDAATVTTFNIPSARRFKYDDLLADWSISVALRWP